MSTNRQSCPSPQLYTSTISDAINRYSLMGTLDHHSGSFHLSRSAPEEKNVASHSDWTALQEDTSGEEGELQTYTSIVLGGTNEPMRRRATEGEFPPRGWRGEIKQDSPKERPLDVLLEKQAKHDAEWTKHILKILLTAEEANKVKDFQDVIKTIEHEEIKELLLHHSKVVLFEIKKIYGVLGGLVNDGGGRVGRKGRLDVPPREGLPLNLLRSKRGKPNLRAKKWYLLNRYYRRLCRIYEEENSLLRRLLMGSPVGDANEVEALPRRHNHIAKQTLLGRCVITYQAKVGRTFPVEMKSKWIRGALKRGSKHRLNLKRDTRIFRFVPHVDMVKGQLGGESLSEEGSEPSGGTQNSQVDAPKMSTSKCYVYPREEEVKSCSDMAMPNGPIVNDCEGDEAMEVGVKGQEEKHPEGVIQEEKNSRQDGPLFGEEAPSGGDVGVNASSEQAGEAPVEDHPKKELTDGHEKGDNHLGAANSKLGQIDKKTKLKKKKKVGERREKGEKKKKKKLNAQQTNAVTGKEENGGGDHPLADVPDKATEEANEGVVLCQEVYHDCTH
ncbi:unnamed protein product [Plasmodium vivax]|nr:unnamed protein product [Plasmodium vivax]CAI7718565.1 conserved Plasmodium protein, unknown function [Plasmodium vivax]